MSQKKSLKQVLAHPRVVKFISIITALCIIATFAINAIAMYAAYELSWGFADSPSRFQPNVMASSNSTTIIVAIPVYVNNTASIGFGVDALSLDISISNSSRALITHATSNIGNIPWGTNKKFNVTVIDANILTDLPKLNTTNPLYFDIQFHVSYAFTMVTISVSIEKTGGMSF